MTPKKVVQFQFESLPFIKLILIPISLWNIYLWNAVIIEKTAPEYMYLQKHNSWFRLEQSKSNAIGTCTKSRIKTETVIRCFLKNVNTDFDDISTG